VSDDRYIVLNVWIAIEKLVSLAEKQNSAVQQNDHGDSEHDAQRHPVQLPLLSEEYLFSCDKVTDAFDGLLRRVRGIFY
jgi:hypothetical protein